MKKLESDGLGRRLFAIPLALANGVDRLTDVTAALAALAAVVSCFISAGNALIRYLFNSSSNGWLEIQWYLFAACVMLGAAQVLRLNEHVRVDVIYGSLPVRWRVGIDLMGLVAFLLPVMLLMLRLSWPLFMRAWDSGESSSNSGGLVRWPALLMLPLGFGLVTLQGVAEIIKRAGWLAGVHDMSLDYERPPQ